MENNKEILKQTIKNAVTTYLFSNYNEIIKTRFYTEEDGAKDRELINEVVENCKLVYVSSDDAARSKQLLKELSELSLNYIKIHKAFIEATRKYTAEDLAEDKQFIMNTVLDDIMNLK